MAGIADLQAALVAALGPYVPISVGKRELARNCDFPQYFIVPKSETYSTPEGPGASGNPRVLHSRKLVLEIYSWGSDFSATEDLHEAMITALRGVLSGANYQIQAAEWENPSDMDRGVTVVMLVEVRLNVTQKVLPIPAPTSAPDALFQTIPFPPTAFDNTTTVFGDSKLDGGETS